MIPQSIIDRFKLEPSDHVIGDSVANMETIYRWPAFTETGMYVVSCDDMGKPLGEGVLRLLCITPDRRVWLRVTTDLIMFIDDNTLTNLVSQMIYNKMDGDVLTIDNPQQ